MQITDLFFSKFLPKTIQTKNGFFANEFLFLPPVSKMNITKNKNGATTD